MLVTQNLCIDGGMDEKRTAVAVLISICAILLYSEFVMDPYIKQGAQASAASAAAIKAAAANNNGIIDPAANAVIASSGLSSAGNLPATNLAGSNVVLSPSLATIAASGEVVIENDAVRAKVSLLGGRLSSYALKAYQNRLGEESLVELVSSLDGAPLPLGLQIGTRSDAEILYTAQPSPDGLSVTLTAKNGVDVGTIKKTISLSPTGYLSLVEAEVSSLDAPLSLEWNHFVSANDGHARLNPVSFKVMGRDNKLTNTLAGDLPSQTQFLAAPLWLGFGDRYFLATLIPNQPEAVMNGEIVSQQRTDSSHIFSIRLGGSAQGNGVSRISAKLYGGPKSAEILAAAQPGLERTIDLGWFSFLAFPLLAGLKILHGLFLNWGLAIVALTLVLKALFLPLTKASFGSMKAMQALQPEMKAMREKIKDPAVLNQEMLKLYQKHKVNPMGGCLPVLLQVPVFIGLYNVLLNAIELRHAPFALWIHDLASPEALTLAGIHVPLMVLILGVSMFFQQYYTPTAGLDPMQRKIMLFMPIVLTGSFLIYPLPAGLVLYWVVNNTISIVQQIFLRTDRKLNPYQATAIAGALMFIFALVLTRI